MNDPLLKIDGWAALHTLSFGGDRPFEFYMLSDFRISRSDVWPAVEAVERRVAPTIGRRPRSRRTMSRSVKIVRAKVTLADAPDSADAAVIADWLEERGHRKAADDLRKSFPPC